MAPSTPGYNISIPTMEVEVCEHFRRNNSHLPVPFATRSIRVQTIQSCAPSFSQNVHSFLVFWGVCNVHVSREFCKWNDRRNKKKIFSVHMTYSLALCSRSFYCTTRQPRGTAWHFGRRQAEQTDWLIIQNAEWNEVSKEVGSLDSCMFFLYARLKTCTQNCK